MHGRSESLLEYAITYDINAQQLLKDHIFDTPLEHNITEFRETIHDVAFAATCANLTDDARTELTVQWGEVWFGWSRV